MEELLTEISTLAKSFGSLSKIYHGALTKDESVSIYLGPSGDIERYFDKKGSFEANITFLAKYQNQKTSINTLDAIGRGFEQLTTFPALTDTQIFNIDYTTKANLVEKTEDNKYIYSIVILVGLSDK